MPPLMTQAEYARHRKNKGLPGQTRQSVSKKIKAGAIPVVAKDGKFFVNPADADRAWSGNADIVKGREVSPGNGKPGSRADGASDLTRARTKKINADAAVSSLKAMKNAGLLLERKAVEKQLFDAMRILRDQMRGLPAKMAPQLAVEASPPKIQALLLEEIDFSLSELAESFEQFPGIGDARTLVGKGDKPSAPSHGK